jgi:hypothetical protein
MLKRKLRGDQTIRLKFKSAYSVFRVVLENFYVNFRFSDVIESVDLVGSTVSPSLNRKYVAIVVIITQI